MKNQPERRGATNTSGPKIVPDSEVGTNEARSARVSGVQASSPPSIPNEPTGEIAPPSLRGPLAFRDFVPRQLSGFGVFKVAEYESFDAAVAAANQWIVEQAIEVVQLETVVLPNIWSKYEEGTLDASIGTSGGMTAHWHQFLRVWHQVNGKE